MEAAKYFCLNIQRFGCCWNYGCKGVHSIDYKHPCILESEGKCTRSYCIFSHDSEQINNLRALKKIKCGVFQCTSKHCPFSHCKTKDEINKIENQIQVHKLQREMSPPGVRGEILFASKINQMSELLFKLKDEGKNYLNNEKDYRWLYSQISPFSIIESHPLKRRFSLDDIDKCGVCRQDCNTIKDILIFKATCGCLFHLACILNLHKQLELCPNEKCGWRWELS